MVWPWSRDNLRYVLGIHHGSTIVNTNSNGNAVVLDTSAINGLLGRAFDNTKDCFLVMNGDTNQGDFYMTGGYWPTDKKLFVHANANTTVRVNWILLAG
jgi:hypothetical protein